MKKIGLITLFFICIANISYSQINKDGLPFIETFTDKNYGDAGQIWAMTQDSRGIMYFGCNYGLKTYDGKTWKSYSNPNTTIYRSLASDNIGNVYYGAEGDFGIIIPDSIGGIEFYSLYLNFYPNDLQIDFSSIWKIYVLGNKVFFQSAEKIFYTDIPIKIDKSKKLLNKIKELKPDKSPFHLSFVVNNKLYVREWEKGLSVFENDKLVLVPQGEQFALTKIYSMLPYDDKRILIATWEAGLFLFDPSKKDNAITPFVTENDQLIKGIMIYTGNKFGNDIFLYGTINSGIIAINKAGKIVMHLDVTTGLPNQMVLSSYYNNSLNNGVLWFFYDDFGIYKANLAGPFFQWDKFTGIAGTASDIIRFNNELYLSASNGLYMLRRDESNSFKFVLVNEIIQAWDMEIFELPDKSSKKLLLGSYDGVFEINNGSITQIAPFPQAFKLYQSKKNPNNLYVSTSEGLALLSYENGKWINRGNHQKISITSRSIYENKDYLAVGTNAGVLLMKDFYDQNITVIDSTRGLPLLGLDFSIFSYKDKTIIASGGGLYSINMKDTTVEPFYDFGKQYTDKHKSIYNFFELNDSYWMSVYDQNVNNANHRLIRFIGKEKLVPDTVFATILPPKTTYFAFADGDYIWVGNEKGLFKFNNKTVKNYGASFNTIISKVTIKEDSVIFGGMNYTYSNDIYSVNFGQNTASSPILRFNDNQIIFEWAAPFYEKEDETQYSYRLKGESDAWSKWDKKSDTRYTNLWEGDYTFQVKARNIYNTESTVAEFSFTILPPWYRTWWAYLIFFIAAVVLVWLIIKLYTKKLKRENEKLEQTVKERTSEIRMQKEEIEAQRDEIQVQKDVVEKAKDKIEKQQKSIMDSIHYALRIQEALLPPDELLQEVLGNHFVLFRPRDIVSGDFYWATQKGNQTVIVVADCTGHGVPGAFMSMLGMSFLNEIVNKEGIMEANIILNRLRENVKKSLRQTGKDNEAKDGMDISLCIIDWEKMKLQYAGAYNPLFLLREGQMERIKADRMPIGIYLREKESFTNNIIDIKKGDYLYLTSDGFIDQFGGPTDDKVKADHFSQVLVENHKKTPEEQKQALIDFLVHWMSFEDKTGRRYKQIDDILVFGIEI
jgi:serine phosphatase RsbU (regulator of sigma subunit)